MTTTRRTILTMLGLGAATSTTLAAGNFSESSACGYSYGVDPTRAAAALRALADDVESGGSLVHSIAVSAEANRTDFLVHELRVSLVFRDELPGS